jgi:hypothetical protein
MRREMLFVLFVRFVVASLYVVASSEDNPLPSHGFDITLKHEVP